MAKYIVAENVIHYHEIEIDDELNIDEIVEEANSMTGRRNTGYEALDELLKKYQNKFDFNYEIRPNYCGAISMGMEISEEE